MVFLDRAVAELKDLVSYLSQRYLLLDDAAELILSHGKTALIATGKPHHASVLAVKIANSYGLRWIALDATHALHGDLGILHPKDLVIYLSKSGETEEVLGVARYLKDLDSIALTCTPESRLARLCDMTIPLPLPAEHSLYGKAPMLSSVVFQLVLFELITIVAAERSSKDLYLSAHPGGAIGLSRDHA